MAITRSQSTIFFIILGNILTKYDQALFTLLIPVIGPILFSSHKKVDALILSYSFLSLDFISRPLGAFFFGWVSDRFGRIQALHYSFMGISVTTFLMGILVSPLAILSPLSLSIIRLFHGFFAAGESSNGALYLVESGTLNKKAFLSGLYDASSTLGWLSASLCIMSIATFGTIESQWPWLFRIGSMVGLFGLFFRNALQKKNQTSSIDLQANTSMRVVSRYWKQLFALTLASGFSYSSYSFAFILFNGYLPLIHASTYQAAVEMNTLFILIDIILLPAWGYCAGKFGIRRQMLWSSGIMIVSTLPIFFLMQTNYLSSFLLSRLWVVIVGTAFSSTYYAWAQSSVPVPVRGRIVSLGYALGSRGIGVPMLTFSLFLFKKTMWVGAPILCLGITALGAFCAVYQLNSISNS